MSGYKNNLNGEENPLNHAAGMGVEQPEDNDSEVISMNEDPTVSYCNDKYHRKLAVTSIVCGFSCLGVPALIYSVKAENADKAEKAKRTTDKKSTEYLKQAKKFGIISIVTWVALLVLAFLVLVLVLFLLLVPECVALEEIC